MMRSTYTTCTIFARDEALPAEPKEALASIALLADLLGSHPQIGAYGRSTPLRVPGGYVVSLSVGISPALATRRVKAVIASATPQAEMFEVKSH